MFVATLLFSAHPFYFLSNTGTKSWPLQSVLSFLSSNVPTVCAFLLNTNYDREPELKQIAKQFLKSVGNDLLDISALELRVAKNAEVEELEALLLKSATVIFELKRLVSSGVPLLAFFEGVDHLVSSPSAKEALRWKRENTKRLKDCDVQRQTGTVTGRISSFRPEMQEIPRKKRKPSGMATYCKLNIGCAQQPKTAGFWRENEKIKEGDRYPVGSLLPFPVMLKLEAYHLDEFLTQLSKIERKARSKRFKGWSTNRWDGSSNGSSEFNYKGWRWPAGYRTYLEGGLLPSKTFFKFIMGYDLPGLQQF